MIQSSSNNAEKITEKTTDNSGIRTAQTNQDPSISLEEARNANEGKTPNASGSTTPATAEDYVPSRADSQPTDLPSADQPKP